MLTSIKIPGSKSITNRALILAALSNEEIILKNALICDDSIAMMNSLQKLGIKIEQKGNEIRIEGCGGQFPKQNNPIELYTGNAGTAARFVTALSTLTGNEITIDGDKRMRKRPIAPLVRALTQLGADIKTTDEFIPLLISRKKLKGGKISIPGNISSQYISALLLSCPFAKEDTVIKIDQEVCSKPYIKITLALLNKFGIEIENNNFEQFKVKGNQRMNYPHLIYKIESDASSGSYPAAYAALHNTKAKLENIFPNSIQGDIAVLKLLEKTGCQTSSDESGTTIKGPKTLKTLGEIDMNETPDLVMTFAILAIFTKGKTLITNIANLRVKETDRLQALENEIKKLNIEVKTGDDYIEIKGNPDILKNPPTQKIEIETYNDHRIAMSFGIIKNLFPNMEIKNPDCVNKTYPNFWKDLKKL